MEPQGAGGGGRFNRVQVCIHNDIHNKLYSYTDQLTTLYSSKFSRSINFVIFVRCKLITKILSTNFFSPMGMSIRVAMNHENCCL